MTARRVALFALLVVALAARCSPPERTLEDLTRAFGEARKQPAAESFELSTVTLGGRGMPAISASGSTRLTFHVTVLPRSRFRVFLGRPVAPALPPDSAVSFLVGVSDGHSYRELRSVPLDASKDAGHWQALDVSLEEYAGLTVDLILNTRAPSGAPDSRTIAVWGAPVVVAP